ncbi:MAG: transglycosylase family protein [Solirubrobacteraceae bacterium]
MSSRTPRPAPRHARTPRRARYRGGLALIAAGAGILASAAPAAAQTLLLSQGSDGSAVARVQRALHVGASGVFNGSTKRAVLVFQRRHGLVVDGIVGPQTWAAMFGGESSRTSTGGSSASSTAGGYAIPSSIVQCESGGNYSAVNPSSGAGGAYQILPSTWRAYGGQGLPQNAPKAEQDRIAGEIWAQVGSSAWVC